MTVLLFSKGIVVLVSTQNERTFAVKVSQSTDDFGKPGKAARIELFATKRSRCTAESQLSLTFETSDLTLSEFMKYPIETSMTAMGYRRSISKIFLFRCLWDLCPGDELAETKKITVWIRYCRLVTRDSLSHFCRETTQFMAGKSSIDTICSRGRVGDVELANPEIMTL